MSTDVTLSNPAKSAACNAVVDLLDVGSNPAQVVIRQGTTTLVTIQLPNPAFGDAVNGVASALGLPISGISVAAGTMDNYQVIDRSGALQWSGSVGTSNSGMIVDGTSIALGQGLSINNWTHTVP